MESPEKQRMSCHFFPGYFAQILTSIHTQFTKRASAAAAEPENFNFGMVLAL